MNATDEFVIITIDCGVASVENAPRELPVYIVDLDAGMTLETCPECGAEALIGWEDAIDQTCAACGHVVEYED